MGTVTNQISVRVIPSKDANVTGTLDAGTVVEILRQETIADITWGMISTPVSGWICMDYVKMYSSQNGSASSVHTEKESHIYYLSYYYFVLWCPFFNCWYKATRFLTVIIIPAVAPQSIYGNQSHINIKSFIIKFLLSCSMLPFQYPSYQNP